MDKYHFETSPQANTESMVTGPNYRFTVINDVVLRYEWSHDGVFEDRASTFAINREFPKPKFDVNDSESELQLVSPNFHLTYNKQRFDANGFHITFTSKLTDWGAEWRYGSSQGGNLGGTARTLDNVDGRCDLGEGVISRSGFVALDDSTSMLFDGKGFVAPRRTGDRIDGYIFAYGNDYKAAMNAFYDISGKQPILPRWALGNWWSRYYAYNADEYLDLMQDFKRREIPLSVAVIDMDWHVVKGDEVPHAGWTGYTWNKKLFPDPEGFMKKIHDMKLKITLNDHPHSGVHSHEDLYEEIAKALEHDTSKKAPILFDPASPEFMHAFFNVLHRAVELQGCDFWWIDWQQGPFSRIPGMDPLWLLNHFQYHDAESQKSRTGSRPIIFSRYGGPGSHRYPVGFSGDSITTWESLKFQPEFTATASNIGFGWWSHDIGGHMFGYRNDELTVRWIQSGVFSPIMRLHSSNSRWMGKEPWRYKKQSELVMNTYLRLRHQLIPYLYSMNVSGSRTNKPIVQPMYWNYPAKPAAYRVPNQFYFGSSMIVNPAVTPVEKVSGRAKTTIWIPPGQHVDFFTGTVYDGNREIDTYRTLEQTPVLLPKGSIIPMDTSSDLFNGCANPSSYKLLVAVGQDGEFTIIEDERDDDDSKSTDEIERTITIKFDQKSGQLTFPASGKKWEVHFLALANQTESPRILVGDTSPTVKAVTNELATIVEVPPAQDPASIITIKLGPNPELKVVDHTNAISDYLEQAQAEIEQKNDVWEIVRAAQPTGVKIGRLLSLGFEEALVGPILELLLADSRADFGGCYSALDACNRPDEE